MQVHDDGSVTGSIDRDALAASLPVEKKTETPKAPKAEPKPTVEKTVSKTVRRK